MPSDHTPSLEPNDSPILLTEEKALEMLRKGEMAEKGLLPYSSNHSFLATVAAGDFVLPVVYKPRRGESPLWDFEWGSLCLRETAAYEISHFLDWNLVPPTVLRNGTRGIGSVQLYIDNDDEEHYFTVQADARFSLTLRRLALLDFAINNADRKSGHCLIGSDHRLWAIDHGVCFHTEYKLRTVIWEFSDEPIHPELLQDLSNLYRHLANSNSALSKVLCPLLGADERNALRARVKHLLRSEVFPAPLVHRRNYPWPPI